MKKTRWLGGFLLSYAAVVASTAALAGDASEPTAALRAKHRELREALARNPFGRPLHLDSTQNGDRLQGELYAVLGFPLATLGEALGKPAAWCDILVMPMHLQQCGTGSGAGNLALSVTPRLEREAANAIRLQFAFQVAAKNADYAAIEITAPNGPLGTRNYRIALDAIALDASHSFIHLTYSYGYGTLAKLAAETYLSTSGRGKPGFTMVQQSDGKRAPVSGMRGVVERNAMRYFLAVDAYLGSLSSPAGERVDRRLKAWHASLERHPQQLREPQPDYLALKREQMMAIGKGG